MCTHLYMQSGAFNKLNPRYNFIIWVMHNSKGKLPINENKFVRRGKNAFGG